MIESTITIITKNEERNIGSCLEAIYSQKDVGPFEVVVVDSGSTDATVAIARRFPVRLEQIPAEAFHHARTRNLAASFATGRIIVGLSGDAIPASEFWLRSMLANFSDPGVGAVYGRQLPKPGSTIERQETFDMVYGAEKVIKDPAHRNGLGYRFYHFSDANAAIRRSIWETTPYPEELKALEDLGIAKRILDSGWKIVYEPEGAVYHSHNYTPAGLFKRYFDIGYTMRHLEIWDAPGTRSSLMRDLRKLLRKHSAPRDSDAPRQLFRTAITEDLAKSAGMLVGLNQRFLPVAVKKHLSFYRVFG
jgi:rhamnosyltransferase